jgi:hypothetical protein
MVKSYGAASLGDINPIVGLGPSTSLFIADDFCPCCQEETAGGNRTFCCDDGIPADAVDTNIVCRLGESPSGVDDSYDFAQGVASGLYFNKCLIDVFRPFTIEFDYFGVTPAVGTGSDFTYLIRQGNLDIHSLSSPSGFSAIRFSIFGLCVGSGALVIAPSIPNNTWVHVIATWDLSSIRLQASEPTTPYSFDQTVPFTETPVGCCKTATVEFPFQGSEFGNVSGVDQSCLIYCWNLTN